MKRFVFLCLASFVLLLPASAQILFQDDFQAASINRFSVGVPDTATSWTLYNDKNEPSTSNPDFSAFTLAWNVFRDADGSMQAAAVSFFRQAGTADRWLVSRALDLSATKKPMLVFRAKAMDVKNRDGFVVKLSSSGKEKSDFSTTLQTTRNATGTWAYYTIDLSEYRQNNIRLAFIQNSSDKNMLCLDDIVVFDVEAVSGLMTGICAPASLVMQGNTASVQAKATLFNSGSEAIVSYTLCQKLNNGNVVRKDVSGVNIASMTTAAITANLDITTEGLQTIALWVENINGKGISSNVANTTTFSVKESSLPRQNTLLEIFSSGMCTACAPWNRVLHPFFIKEKANMPDNSGHFSVAKFQVDIPSAGDPTVTDQTLARCKFYNIGAAPSFYLNGKPLALGDTGVVFGTLRSTIASCRQQTLPTGFSVSLEREGNTFKLHTKVTNYLTDVEDYRLVVCLMEDTLHLMTTMHNGEKDYYNVVRQMLPDEVGMSIVPETLGQVIENDFEYTFDLQNPAIYSSVENMGAVVFLQTQKTKKVVQSFYLRPGFSATNKPTQPFKKQLSLSPNPANDRCEVAFDALRAGKGVLQVFDAQGKMIHSESLALQNGKNRFSLETAAWNAGIYFVRISNEQGVFTHKLMKR